jgi:Ca2+-binding EF-hand superfamily protein
MSIKRLSLALPFAAALVMASTSSWAQSSGPTEPIAGLFKMANMDKNKDGMISKKEFLDMMSKAWDMQAAEMKVKGGKMTGDQIKELERILGRTLGG